MEKLGLMTDLGRAVLPDMTDESFAVAPEILEALQADQRTWENYLALPELYKRIRIDNIQGYLKTKDTDGTYENRLQKFLDNTRDGKIYGEWNDVRTFRYAKSRCFAASASIFAVHYGRLLDY